MTAFRGQATMTMRRYKATCRKLHVAHAALVLAIEPAKYYDNMCAATSALARAADEMRVQVCAACSELGYHPTPGNPNSSTTCQHPDVPRFKVAVGEWRPADQWRSA